MTIREVLRDQEGNVVAGHVLPRETDLPLGHRIPEGADRYDESILVLNPDTIEVLRETILPGRKIKEERRILQAQAINDEGLTRDIDTNRVSYIVWEESKPQQE